MRQLLQQYAAVEMDESEVESIEGINRLLCFEVVEVLEEVGHACELPASLQKPLHWVENHYKIALSSQALASDPGAPPAILYMLDKSYLAPAHPRHAPHARLRNTFDRRNTDDTGPPSPTSPNYKAITAFLSLSIEGYLVLLIELLQRHMLAGAGSEAEHVMVLIEAELDDQIRAYLGYQAADGISLMYQAAMPVLAG